MSDDRTLTREQLKAVIEKAARWTEESDRIPVAELLAIAEELEFDPRAIEAALQEVLSEDAPLTRRERRAHFWSGKPKAADLRVRRHLASLAFLISSAALTPGDSLSFTFALLGSGMLLYELSIRVLSLMERGGGGPASGTDAFVDRPGGGSLSSGTDGSEDRGLLERVKDPFVTIEEGVRAFQLVVRSL